MAAGCGGDAMSYFYLVAWLVGVVAMWGCWRQVKG